MQNAVVTSIYTYPIKSCAGIELQEAVCDELGIVYDRQWAIVNDDIKILTQRDKPAMALIRPRIAADGSLSLSAPGMTPLTISPSEENKRQISFNVWADASTGFDQGDRAAAWLSDFLGQTCRLVRNDKEFTRPTKLTKPNGEPGRVAFADGYPLLIVSEESLEDLNQRLDTPMPMDRFRPSVVLKGLGPYGEDRCKQLSSAEINLYPAKPCPRCVLVTVDQTNGQMRGPEPLKTISQYRRLAEKAIFGYYFIPSNPGMLRVGSTLEPLIS